MTMSEHHVGRSVLISVALALVTTSLACSRGPAPAPPAAQKATTAQDGLSGESIFDLDLPMVDHDGQATTLAALKGQVTLAAMVYTSCTAVCIMVTEDMKRIERQLSGADADVQYVLFSLDPGRDTPAAMRQFAADHRLDLKRWRLLAASEDGVRDLAAVLGVKYRQEANGEIAHSAMIFVIDPDGVVLHRQDGVGQDPSTLLAALENARG